MLQSILISRIQELYPYDADMANTIYEAAKAAECADEEEAVWKQYDVDIHVYQDGATIVHDDYEERYAIIDYTPCRHTQKPQI